MRARSLKPGLFANEVLGQADPLITILFEGLWCSADREGRLEDKPLKLCGTIFPYRRAVTEKKVDRWLSWLHEQGFIFRYNDGKRALIQVTEFRKHQNPHVNERPSIYQAPIPIEHSASPVQTTNQAPEHLPPDTQALRSDSGLLTPDSRLLTAGTPQHGASTGVDAPPARFDRQAKPTKEAELAVPLRAAGVNVSSTHPILVAWVADGYTLQHALGAVAIARERKGDNAQIPAAYLDTILRNPHTPKVNGHVNGNGAKGPAKTADEIEDAIIDAAVKQGKTDREIAALEDLQTAPNLPARIGKRRKESQHAEH